MEDLLASLNEEQIKPVCDTEGAVLVLAGAGSGKTRVLTSRIAYILRQNLCAPSNILAITFTNKAAKEMRDRLELMLGDVGGMWICTIHSMCVRILRRFAEEAGVHSNFSIYSDTERNNVIKKAFTALDYDDEKLLKSAKFHIGRAKMLGLEPDQYAVRFKDEKNIDAVEKIYADYNARLKDNNALDFDDLLSFTLRLLRGNQTAREYLSDKFKYVLVDEFQDTNSVQYSIIRLLAAKHGNLFAVGDDDQSIYGWRGAEIENILRFDKDYPQAKVYKLQRNYRSTKAILDLANEVISRNGKRHKKSLWTEAEYGEKPEYLQAEQESDEAYFAAKTINAAVYGGAKYSDFAVLMRINALTRSYEQEFAKYGIPFKVFGGFKFFERREIKDVLAYMRLINNPYDDEAFTRIINVPRRGIGGKTLEAMEGYAKGLGLSLYDACIDADELKVAPSVKTKLRDFAELVKGLVITSQSENVAFLVRSILESTNIKSAYDDGTEEGDAKLANLDEFIASVDDFTRLNPQAGLEEYLSQITLASDKDEMDDGNFVTLATIHSVKGLEFDDVIICGMEEGIMPSSRSEDSPDDLEEERRLMYVAITRARKRLWITRSKSRYIYGRRDFTRPSRFIFEMEALLLEKDGGHSAYGGKSFGSRSTYGYGSRGNSWGSTGYEGDFWETPSRGKSLYSSDEGYQPDSDPVPQTAAKSFSAASTFGGVKRTQNAGGGTKEYSVGMKVRHPKFGNGTVISLKNNGTVVNIAFEGQGIRELSAALAPLEIIK